MSLFELKSSVNLLSDALIGQLRVHRNSSDPVVLRLLNEGLIKPRNKHAKGEFIEYTITKAGRMMLVKDEGEIQTIQHSLLNPRDPPKLSRPKQGYELRHSLDWVRRNGAEAQRNISAVLREAEENPHAIRSGWLPLTEPHELRTLFNGGIERVEGKRSGFTEVRHVVAASRQWRRYFDGRTRPSLDVLTYHALGGGGAVIMRAYTDELAEIAPVHDALIEKFERDWRASTPESRPQRPSLLTPEPEVCYVFLGTHPGIDTFLTMEFR